MSATEARVRIARALGQPVSAAPVADSPYFPGGGDAGKGEAKAAGKGYSEMTPAEFTAAQNARANAGWFERNAPMIFGGSFGRAMQAFDDSAFNNEMQSRANAVGLNRSTPVESLQISQGGGYGGGATGAMGGQTAGGTANTGVEGDKGFLARGGVVTPGDLSGPDPEGPDDGYAALKVGEVVLNKDQQKKVGREHIARALAR